MKQRSTTPQKPNSQSQKSNLQQKSYQQKSQPQLSKPHDVQTQGRQQSRQDNAPVQSSSIYKSATDPSQIELFNQYVKYYDVNGIREIKKENKNVKEVSEECKIDRSVIVKDISMIVSGVQEDEVFVADPQLWANVRRGNTILELYDPQDYQKLLKVVYGRKGMNKFFDLDYQFVSRENRYVEDHLKDYDYYLKLCIFAPIKKALLEGHKIEIVQTLKANGENTQVSWNPELQAWIIASKNVSVIAREVEDLNLYPPQQLRYSFALMMADCWFKILDERGISKNKKLLDSLKSDLTNRTLVGEYVGNPQCQHIVKYPRETIIFYALVNNYSNKICQLNEDAMRLIKKYGFDTVDMETLGVYTDYDHICDDLEEYFRQIASSSIAEYEEGSVIYIIKRDANSPKQDEVLSLTKVKTLEYRILRKMREKLRNYVSGKTKISSDQSIEKFYKESKDLVKGFQIPHPLDYYMDLCVNAFKFINSPNKREADYFINKLNNEYITFLEEVILETGSKGGQGNRKKYQNKIDFVSTVLDAQDQIDYIGYDEPRSGVKEEKKKPQVQQTQQIQTSNREVTQKSQTQQTPQSQQKPLGNTIIVIAPPFTISEAAIEALQNESNIIYQEDSEFKRELLQVKDGRNKDVTLLYVSGLKNIAQLAESHTEKLYYFMYGYDKGTFIQNVLQNFRKHQNQNDDSSENGIDIRAKTMYCPLSMRKDLTEEKLKQFIQAQEQLIDGTLAKLKDLSNVSTSFQSETDLVQRIMNAYQKLYPIIRQPDDKRQVSLQSNSSQEKASSVTSKSKVPDQRVNKLQQNNQTRDRSKSNTHREVSNGKKKVQIVEPSEQEIKTAPQHKPIHSPPQILSSSQKIVLIIIPVGIPGMGKSHFIENILLPYVKSVNAGFQTISNDKIRREVMDEYKRKHHGASEDDAFNSTFKENANAFNKKFNEILSNAAEKSSNNREIIFIDKNHPPQAIGKTIDEINYFADSFKNVKFVKLAMIPEIERPYKDFPFSLTFLVSCYIRCMARDVHDTLHNTDKNHLARVLFKFMKFYLRQKFDKNYLDINGFTDFLKIPFTYEHEDIQLPKNLKECVEKGIDYTLNKDIDKPDPLFDRFHHLVTVYQKYFGGSLDQHRDLQSALDKQFHQYFPSKQPEPIIKKTSTKDTPAVEMQYKPKEPRQVLVVNNTQTTKTPVAQETQQSTSTVTPKETTQTETVRHVEKVTIEQAQQIEKQKEEEKKQYKVYQPRTVVKQQPVELDFQTSGSEFRTVTTKGQGRSKKNALPQYLGISLHEDEQLYPLLQSIIVDDFKKFFEIKQGSTIINQNYESFKKVWQGTGKKLQPEKLHQNRVDGWRLPDDFHVTCLYVGKDRDIVEESPIYKNFQENLEIDVEIVAMVVVPGKLIAGVCFPEYSNIANKVPHVTLMVNEWQPKHSNDVLEACFIKDKKPFALVYDELKKTGQVKNQQNHVLVEQVKVLRDQPTVTCILVVLDQPVKFLGVTKTYV